MTADSDRWVENFRHSIFPHASTRSSDAILMAFPLSLVYLKTYLHILFWIPNLLIFEGQYVTPAVDDLRTSTGTSTTSLSSAGLDIILLIYQQYALFKY